MFRLSWQFGIFQPLLHVPPKNPHFPLEFLNERFFLSEKNSTVISDNFYNKSFFFGDCNLAIFSDNLFLSSAITFPIVHEIGQQTKQGNQKAWSFYRDFILLAESWLRGLGWFWGYDGILFEKLLVKWLRAFFDVI